MRHGRKPSIKKWLGSCGLQVVKGGSYTRSAHSLRRRWASRRLRSREMSPCKAGIAVRYTLGTLLEAMLPGDTSSEEVDGKSNVSCNAQARPAYYAKCIRDGKVERLGTYHLATRVTLDKGGWNAGRKVGGPSYICKRQAVIQIG